MKAIDTITKKEIIDLLNKCWMTHDGMWFFHCLQEFKLFFIEAAKLMIPDFMNVKFSFPEENKMTWVFNQGKCLAYKGVNRLGVIDQYECGVLYRIKCWLEELGIEHRFSPEIDRCHMHHNGDCSGYI